MFHVMCPLELIGFTGEFKVRRFEGLVSVILNMSEVMLKHTHIFLQIHKVSLTGVISDGVWNRIVFVQVYANRHIFNDIMT